MIRNTEYHYGFIAIFLHWFMAFLIVGLVMLGLYMVSLPDAGFDMSKIFLILLHKEIGMVAFVLAIIRLFWRWVNPLPELADTVPLWQKISARFVHVALYGFMLALPLTGWLMSSAAGLPATFLGIFDLPDLMSPNIYRVQFFIDVHQYLSYGLITLIIIHICAALLHHFFYKDNTLKKILP
jgi:cytochrome b561